MIGLLKVAVAGFSASLAMGALSSGALAHEQDSSKHSAPSTSCQQSGNQIVQQLTFATSKGTSSSLSGRVASPDTVVASFTVPSNCSVPLSLVSYTAPGPSFDANTADKQTVFDHTPDGAAYGAGHHSLTVKVPACYFQVDFVRGAIIDKFGPAGSNNFYSPQGRLIAADNGGSTACGSGGTGGTTSAACASSNPQLSNVTYLIGGTTTVTDLRGHAGQGKTVKATFTVPANCSMQLSLASYTAPLPYFTRQSAPQQVLFQSATSPTGGFTAGVHSLSVTLPTCMYQVDFVHGAVLTTLGSTPGTDYEDRLISADNGGTASCSATSPTPTATPTPTSTPTPTPTSTPTSTPTATPTPHTTATTPTPSAPTGNVQAVKTTSTPGAVLAITASTPGTGANQAIGTATLLVLAGLAFLGLSRIRREEV
jgi:hypothetical protein